MVLDIRSFRPPLVPLIIACALFMENLDSTIISTALPQIARSLGAEPLHLSLAITSYLLSLAVFIPLSGWVADRFGAKRIFRAAILVFTLGSVLCGLSQSMTHLVLARALQGMGGAMMVPVGRLVLLRKTPKHALVAAMSWLSMPALLGPILGPPVGGLIVTYASWRWIFFINLPIGILGFWLVTRFIEETPPEPARAMDWRGWLLLGAGLALVVTGFELLGKRIVGDALLVAVLAAGALLLAAYWGHARRHPVPVLDLSLLRVPTFRTSVGGGSLFRIGIGAYTLLMPLMLQLGFGFSAAVSGGITFVSAIGALLMKATAPVLVRRFGFRPLLTGTAVLSAGFLVGCGLLGATTPHGVMLGLLFLFGFFRSLQFTCLNALAFSDVPSTAMSRATSLSSTIQQVALTVGVGIASQLLNASMALRGGAVLQAVDFRYAFFGVAMLTVVSAWAFWRLAPDAGHALRGGPAGPGDRGASDAPPHPPRS